MPTPTLAAPQQVHPAELAMLRRTARPGDRVAYFWAPGKGGWMRFVGVASPTQEAPRRLYGRPLVGWVDMATGAIKPLGDCPSCTYVRTLEQEAAALRKALRSARAEVAHAAKKLLRLYEYIVKRGADNAALAAISGLAESLTVAEVSAENALAAPATHRARADAREVA